MNKITYDEALRWRGIAPDGHLARVIDMLEESIKAKLFKGSFTIDDLLYTAHRNEAVTILIEKDLVTAKRWEKFVGCFANSTPQRRADAHRYVTCQSLDTNLKSGFFNLPVDCQDLALQVLTGACDVESVLPSITETETA